MKQLTALPLIFLLSVAPLRAQEVEPDAEQGFSLLEEGAKILMRSMIAEMQPKLDEMQSSLGEALANLEPGLRELLAMVDDIRNYDAPEMLPNGDIIIRRKKDAPQMTPQPGEKIAL